MFHSEGLPLLGLADGVVEMLQGMKREGIKVVVVVGNCDGMVVVAEQLLGRFGVREMVGKVVAVKETASASGESETGFNKGAWERVVQPWVTGDDGDDAEAGVEVVVVSRAVYDLGIAKEIGARACWVRGFEMEMEVQEKMVGDVELDLMVEGLEELGEKMFEGGHVKVEVEEVKQLEEVGEVKEVEVVEVEDGDDDMDE
jgi:hypothetical protein